MTLPSIYCIQVHIYTKLLNYFYQFNNHFPLLFVNNYFKNLNKFFISKISIKDLKYFLKINKK